MKNTTFTFVLLTLGIAFNLHGQFTQVELFKSLDKSTFNLYSSQYINDTKTLNLATLGFFENYRSSENRDFSEAGIQPTLFWNFSKSFSLGPSIYYNSISGFSERISAKYQFKNERLLIVLMPSLGHYQQKEQIYAETFAQFQLNLPIKGSLSFWVNGQFLNVWDKFKTHSRSFQQLRTGISFKKHQFGMGLDLDHRGPKALSTNAFGMYYRSVF
jgi:hypothetical protein